MRGSHELRYGGGSYSIRDIYTRLNTLTDAAIPGVLATLGQQAPLPPSSMRHVFHRNRNVVRRVIKLIQRQRASVPPQYIFGTFSHATDPNLEPALGEVKQFVSKVWPGVDPNLAYYDDAYGWTLPAPRDVVAKLEKDGQITYSYAMWTFNAEM